jgi:hypothetical protein
MEHKVMKVLAAASKGISGCLLRYLCLIVSMERKIIERAARFLLQTLS